MSISLVTYADIQGDLSKVGESPDYIDIGKSAKTVCSACSAY